MTEPVEILGTKPNKKPKIKTVAFVFWSIVTLMASLVIITTGAWVFIICALVPGVFAWTAFAGGKLTGTSDTIYDPAKGTDTLTNPAFSHLQGNVHHLGHQLRFPPPD